MNDFNEVKLLACIFSGCLGIVTFIIVYYLLGIFTEPLINYLEKKLLGGRISCL